MPTNDEDFYIPKDNSPENWLYEYNTDRKERIWKVEIYLFVPRCPNIIKNWISGNKAFKIYIPEDIVQKFKSS